MTESAAPTVLEAGRGDHLHFLNHLATIKVAAASDAAFSAVEFLAPHGTSPPLHRHEREDELFVVLDGRMRFRSGDVEHEAASGATAFLPRQAPHTFQVVSESARFLAITAASDGEPPRFDELVRALGTSTDSASLPTPGHIDPNWVTEVCREYGVEVVGPPMSDLPPSQPKPEGDTR